MNNYKVGDTVSVRGGHYQLAPEQIKKGCQGCYFYNHNNCDGKMTNICRQGFIFNRVKR